MNLSPIPPKGGLVPGYYPNSSKKSRFNPPSGGQGGRKYGIEGLIYFDFLIFSINTSNR
jgi:hypothetical protein